MSNSHIYLTKYIPELMRYIPSVLRVVSMLLKGFYCFLGFCCFSVPLLCAQELYPPLLAPGNWHAEQRSIRYQPVDRDFMIHNGSRRFTRALYGTHTAFRVEAGDLPEFAMYMPGMGGNLQFGLLAGKESKWLIKAESITARYRAGSMYYEIKDPMLGQGTLYLVVLALSKAEGMVIKARFENVKQEISLFWSFGGASGAKFSRSGDMGLDPESSFYLQPENCKGNVFVTQGNLFSLKYGKDKVLNGIFPSALLKIGDASNQISPAVLDGAVKDHTVLNGAVKQHTVMDVVADRGLYPVLTGKLKVQNAKDFYFLIQNPESDHAPSAWSVEEQFMQAEAARKLIADRIQLDTPDPYINTVAAALSVASDAIWESPSYLHGAIGWRMRLPGWRGPYTADPLGWHDRARTHFRAYAKSQLLNPVQGPVVADTALNLARSKETLGTAMFSAGYISREPEGKSLRAHHYDMNLVYIDALLWHLNWTGDLSYAREMWPVIQRHLAWEKRVFDADDNGLYDAYAAIWASDALQYSGGSVTHSSAYNYRANSMAARIASLLHEDPIPYQNEADKIIKAINTQLWMPAKGWYAEYKDALGLQQLHPAAGLWTIYHCIDSDVPDLFQAWQSLRYIDTSIPHIPVRAAGLPDKGYYTLSTSNWMPYEWSLNNVVLAESTHTALANWQAGRTEEAFKLWKSEILSSMYLGGSPGNFAQISHYDASSGESYRDFGDPVGINSRALVEGLFGIVPDALAKTLNIRPGLPAEWSHATLKIPDLSFSFKRDKMHDVYTLIPSFSQALQLRMRIKVMSNGLKYVKLNGKLLKWKNVNTAIACPEIEISAQPATKYKIELVWSGKKIAAPRLKAVYAQGEVLDVRFPDAVIMKVFDPQQVLQDTKFSAGSLKATLRGEPGNHTAFVQLKNGMFSYWYPLCFELNTELSGRLKNNQPQQRPDLSSADWADRKFEPQDLSAYFNDKVTQIFRNKYLSPRPSTTTLQLPLQGIGDWTHPLIKPEINDSGLCRLAGYKNELLLPSGIVFKTPADTAVNNILFSSQWDNYPHEVEIPVSGKASTVFFLLAGSTNPMQSRMDNGLITVFYTDGTEEKLVLRNPENWWPIEKDMYSDGFAFVTGAERPMRIHLKTGRILSSAEGAAWNGKDIDGGAATALGLTLDPGKSLSKIRLSALCNDVVIGVMGITLVR